jgi:hypothetical protein
LTGDPVKAATSRIFPFLPSFFPHLRPAPGHFNTAATSFAHSLKIRDIAAGAYEHILRAQAMGHDIRAVIELGRFPGVVLAVGRNQPFKSHADLKGIRP